MSPALRAAVRDCKPELLELLRRAGPGWTPAELALITGAGLDPSDVPLVGAAKVAFADLGGLTLVGFKPLARPQVACGQQLSGPWREVYEERAGVMEFEGNLPREHAEALALADTRALMSGSIGLSGRHGQEGEHR